MSKIFNKFLIGLLFLLGVMLIPTFKADATLTVTVKANGQNPLTVNSGTWVEITWSAPSATTCDNNFNPTDHRTNGEYGYTATTTQTFTVNCSSMDVQGSFCSSGSNIGESLATHKLQSGGVLYVPSGGYAHHYYENWVTSGSNIGEGATIKVNRTEFIYPNFAGSQLVEARSCETFSIPPNSSTSSSSFTMLNVDSGPSATLSVASSSYGATKNYLSSAQISNYNIRNDTTYVTGTYYGMTQNSYTSVVRISQTQNQDIYVRLTGSSQMYPYAGSSLVTVPLDVTVKIPAYETTGSTTVGFYGVSGSVSINSAWTY